MKLIGDDKFNCDLQSILISSPSDDNSINISSLFEPIILKNSFSFTILEFGGFLSNNQESICIANSRIVSLLGLDKLLHGQDVVVEKLLNNNEKYINYQCLTNINNSPPNNINVQIKFIDSDDVLKFIDRIKLFESKSIFKKKENFFSHLIKSKLIGKYIMNGERILIECMGVQYPILLNIEETVGNEKSVYYRVTNEFNFSITEDFKNSKPTTRSTNHIDTFNFIEELSNNTLGGLNDQLEGILTILDTLFFRASENYTHLPKTILLWGLQGTGKSTILR